MTELLFEDTAPSAGEAGWTERKMLDLIHDRYQQRAGNGPRYVVAEHVRNQGGFGGYWSPDKKPLRTADALVIDLWPSSGYTIHGFEVKVSRSDWLTELKDPEKAEAFKPYCNQWWLVVPDKGIVRNDLPDGWGLLAIAPDGCLKVAKRAPKLDAQPVPVDLMAAWLRSVAKGRAA
jgi:hypothetical protein